MHLGQTVVRTDAVADHSWLKEVNKHTQMSYTVDPSDAAWVQADHYPSGHIPAGVAVIVDPATGLCTPWAAGASFGGFLFNPIYVTDAIAAPAGQRNVGVAVMIQGYVSLDALPTQGGMTNGGLGADLATARTDMAGNNPSTTLVWIGA